MRLKVSQVFRGMIIHSKYIRNVLCCAAFFLPTGNSCNLFRMGPVACLLYSGAQVYNGDNSIGVFPAWKALKPSRQIYRFLPGVKKQLRKGQTSTISSSRNAYALMILNSACGSSQISFCGFLHLLYSKLCNLLTDKCRFHQNISAQGSLQESPPFSRGPLVWSHEWSICLVILFGPSAPFGPSNSVWHLHF